LKTNENRVSSHDIDTDSYLQFLRAKALGRNRPDRASRVKAIALLEPIVARYPNFAPAWGQLALNYQLMPPNLRENATIEERRRASEQWLARSEAAAERAIELAPTAADGYASLGLTTAFRGRYAQAEDFL